MNSAYNRNASNTQSIPGPLGYIMGRALLPQIVFAILIATALYILFMSFEILYKSFNQIKGTRVPVLPVTVSSQNKQREIIQNPNAPYSKLLPMSDNERTGAEFTYGFFLWVNPSSFGQQQGLLHIMHKGYPEPYPLLGPGVFLKNNANVLRVYMNSTRTWNNYVDVENIPVKKWVHVCIVARNNAVEVYINGNLAKKLNLEGATFYQNFGNLYLFSERKVSINPVATPSVGQELLQINGTYSGMFSNLYYFSYALSYTEILSLVSMGPSKESETDDMDKPPYLEDSWWVSNYSQ
jgi:hypothetical protein